MRVWANVVGLVGAACAIGLLILRIKTMHLLSHLSPAAKRTWAALCWIGVAWIALWSVVCVMRLLVAAMRWLMG